MKRRGPLATTLIVLGSLAAGIAIGQGLWRSGVAGRAIEMASDYLQAGRPLVRIGEAVPAFTLPGLQDGAPRHLPAHGRPMVITYWASWCGPCRGEMPLLSDFAREQGPNGVQVVGIALDDADEARAYLAQWPAGFPQLVEMPGDADSSVHFGNVRGLLPFTVLVDAQGRLQHRKTGAFADADALERWVSAGLP